MIFIAALAVSAVLHAVLLMSDSPDYRQWVYVQIGIQLVGIALLVCMLRYMTIALFLLIPLSAVFTYINAVYTNYGHTTENIVGFLIAWIVYGVLVGKTLEEVSVNPNKKMHRLIRPDWLAARCRWTGKLSSGRS